MPFGNAAPCATSCKQGTNSICISKLTAMQHAASNGEFWKRGCENSSVSTSTLQSPRGIALDYARICRTGVPKSISNLFCPGSSRRRESMPCISFRKCLTHSHFSLRRCSVQNGFNGNRDEGGPDLCLIAFIHIFTEFSGQKSCVIQRKAIDHFPESSVSSYN